MPADWLFYRSVPAGLFVQVEFIRHSLQWSVDLFSVRHANVNDVCPTRLVKKYMSGEFGRTRRVLKSWCPEKLVEQDVFREVGRNVRVQRVWRLVKKYVSGEDGLTRRVWRSWRSNFYPERLVSKEVGRARCVQRSWSKYTCPERLVK